jgi:hypothetical protein
MVNNTNLKMLDSLLKGLSDDILKVIKAHLSTDLRTEQELVLKRELEAIVDKIGGILNERIN